MGHKDLGTLPEAFKQIDEMTITEALPHLDRARRANETRAAAAVAHLNFLVDGDPKGLLVQYEYLESERAAKALELVLVSARLGEQLIGILSSHTGERGDSEGAVEVLERIIRERDLCWGPKRRPPPGPPEPPQPPPGRKVG